MTTSKHVPQINERFEEINTLSLKEDLQSFLNENNIVINLKNGKDINIEFIVD